MGGVPWALAFHLNPSEINPPAIRANKVRLWSQAAFRFPVPPGTTPFLLFILPFHLSVPLLLRIRPPHRAIFSGARPTRDTPLTLILLPSSPPQTADRICGPPSVPDSSNNNFQVSFIPANRRGIREYTGFPLSAGNFKTVPIHLKWITIVRRIRIRTPVLFLRPRARLLPTENPKEWKLATARDRAG